MALIFVEGFEGYGNMSDAILVKGDVTAWYTNLVYIDSGICRTAQVVPANSRSISTSHPWGDPAFYGISFPIETELIVGVGIRFSGGYAVNNGQVTIFQSGQTNSGITVSLNASGNLIVALSDNNGNVRGATLATGTKVMSTSFYQYIEVRIKMGITTGEVEVRVDGVQDILLTSTNTASGVPNGYDRIRFSSASGGVYKHFDDIYLLNTSGTANNTFLGPINVYTLLPAGAGSASELTPVGSSPNWQCVNDATPNYGNYAETAQNGNKDFYTFQSLPVTVTNVAGVMVKARSHTPDSGGRKILMKLKSAANVISSTARQLMVNAWADDTATFDTAPDGTSWTVAKVNAVEGGIEAG